MKSSAIIIFVILSGVFLSSCGITPSGPAPTSVPAPKKAEVAEIASPAAASSAEPNLSAGADGRIYLSWIETADNKSSLKFSMLEDNHSWSPATLVAEGKQWFINSADFPSLIALPNGTLAAHWLSDNKDGTEAYNISLTFSRDNGKSWSNPIIPHRDRSANQHGFVSLVAAGPSQLGAVWLDGKKIRDESGDMSLIYTTIDVDGKIGKETVLDGRVCECCQTSAALTPGGMMVVYRDRSDKEIRDISRTRFVNGNWTVPEPVSTDNWMIDACPVNGPAVSTSGNNAAVAWYTAPNDKAQVNVSLSSDGGKTFGAPVRVDGGTPIGRVDVTALESGSAMVSWLEKSDSGVQVRLRQVNASGASPDAIVASAGTSVSFSGVPRMTRTGNLVVVAWTDKETPSKVHTASVKLP